MTKLAVFIVLFLMTLQSHATSCSNFLMGSKSSGLIRKNWFFSKEFLNLPLEALTDSNGNIFIFRFISGSYDPNFKVDGEVSYYDVNPWAVASRGNFRPFHAVGPDTILVSKQKLFEDGLTRRRYAEELGAPEQQDSRGRILIVEGETLGHLGKQEIRVNPLKENVVYSLPLKSFREYFNSSRLEYSLPELLLWLESSPTLIDLEP